MTIEENAQYFERIIDGIVWGGEAFFDTRERAKQVAGDVRKRFTIACRVIVIPKSNVCLERYLVILPCDHAEKVYDNAAKWIREQEGAW